MGLRQAHGFLMPLNPGFRLHPSKLEEGLRGRRDKLVCTDQRDCKK